jgi:hypothetical protein
MVVHWGHLSRVLVHGGIVTIRGSSWGEKVITLSF